MSPFTWFLFIYICVALVGLAFLWFWGDRDASRSFETSRRRRVFHCVRCGALYSVRRHDVSEGCSCPKCGYKNFELSY